MIPPRLIYKRGLLKILDQRVLPDKIKYARARTCRETAKHIKEMTLRGAPLIGCAAAYGYALSFSSQVPRTWRVLEKKLAKNALLLKKARPTAAALFYAVDRIHKKALDFIKPLKNAKPDSKNRSSLFSVIENEAHTIALEDKISTLKMAEFGASLLKKQTVVLTYCNAGALATMGIGTAIGAITRAAELGKIKQVYACETRPYLQGARLTMWELMKQSVPSILITDNMAGHIMKTCKVNAVIVGADSIASNGDTANKIGTYVAAVLAERHKIPFYVIAPSNTIDLELAGGNEIKIEERAPREVTMICGINIAPESANARHPAFDVTPASLITAIITEKGVIKPVNKTNILKNLNLSVL